MPPATLAEAMERAIRSFATRRDADLRQALEDALGALDGSRA